MRTDMNTCTQPLPRVICLCMLCAVSESVELLSRAHPLNVVLYIELSCMSVSPLCLHMCCGHLHTPCVRTCTVYCVRTCLLVSVCAYKACVRHIAWAWYLRLSYCVWLVCLFRRVYDACLMCTLYSPCVCTVSVQLYSVCVHGLCLHTSFRCMWFGHSNVYMPTHTYICVIV